MWKFERTLTLDLHAVYTAIDTYMHNTGVDCLKFKPNCRILRNLIL
jgi:hypothetical protein